MNPNNIYINREKEYFDSRNDYFVIKRYCPSVRKNVIMKVTHDRHHTEYCTDLENCEKDGGCKNLYFQKGFREMQ